MVSKYYKYAEYLQNKYGVKTYKLPVDLNLTCPNRDGFLGTGGCSYCGAEGGSFAGDNTASVREQLLALKEPIADKYNAQQFIAYFQNFTNTYLPLAQLQDNLRQAVEVDGVVEIALGTRPDCVNEEYLQGMQEAVTQVEEDVNLTLELGLQTANYHTLRQINRGHTLAEFVAAVQLAKQYGVEVGTHLILNLPGDKQVDAVESAKLISALNVDTVKLHALYLRENTELGRRYKRGELELISLAEYIDRVITCLEYLAPDIAVQRLAGKAPKEGTLFVNWGYDYSEINNFILEELEERNTRQGAKFNYLDGKALQKF